MPQSLNLRILLGMLLLLVLSLPVWLLVMFTSGWTHGVEFSPDDFSRRSFTYNQMPWVGWTIQGKEYVDRTNSLEKGLISDGLIKSVNNSPQVWHLTEDTSSISGNQVPAECDARFLTGYLDLRGAEGDLYWEAWNDEHPKLAKILWPIVADLARNEDYLKIPPLMRMAMGQSKDDPESFQLKLRKMGFQP